MRSLWRRRSLAAGLALGVVCLPSMAAGCGGGKLFYKPGEPAPACLPDGTPLKVDERVMALALSRCTSLNPDARRFDELVLYSASAMAARGYASFIFRADSGRRRGVIVRSVLSGGEAIHVEELNEENETLRECTVFSQGGIARLARGRRK